MLYANGQKAEASERFRQAEELCRDHAEAWNNLGVTLGELHRYDEAEKTLRMALKLGFSDAHFNLARVMDYSGRGAEARQHWAAFAKSQPCGVWGAYARRHRAE